MRVVSKVGNTVIGDPNSTSADDDAITFLGRDRVPCDFQFRKRETGYRDACEAGAEDKVAREDSVARVVDRPIKLNSAAAALQQIAFAIEASEQERAFIVRFRCESHP